MNLLDRHESALFSNKKWKAALPCNFAAEVCGLRSNKGGCQPDRETILSLISQPQKVPNSESARILFEYSRS
jgi:hypothetical protein